MKFLEAKKLAKVEPENKMRMGSRPDQKEFIPKGQLHPSNPVSPKKEVVEYAKSVGVDVRTIKGSGRGGEITMKDVRDAKVQDDKDRDDDK